MARWWNRSSQWDGLFDFQNRVRPSYYAFKLLSRLTGGRLRLESTDAAVHGFATWDPKMLVYNVLLWNYSTAPVQVDLAAMWQHLGVEASGETVVLKDDAAMGFVRRAIETGTAGAKAGDKTPAGAGAAKNDSAAGAAGRPLAVFAGRTARSN